MSMQGTPSYAWLDGTLVSWERCVLHVRTPGAFWGANVFEGLRGYWNPRSEQTTLYRGDDHLRRLRRSTHALRMRPTFSDDELREAALELVRANAFHEDVHLCIVAYVGFGPTLSPMSSTEVTGVHITSTPAPRLAAYREGAAATMSSWRRISDESMPPGIKAGANYQNSRLAHHEAIRNGFDVAILLNNRGTVSEAADANVVMHSGGSLVSPPSTSGVLEGITLATVTRLARGLGVPVERREIDRTELYAADEIFVCGTLAEIKPVTSLDRLPVGDSTPGVLTRRLQDLFEEEVRSTPATSAWSTEVPGSSQSNSVEAVSTAPHKSGDDQ